MANTNVNKVMYGDKVLLDLSSDTVTPAGLLEGVTAHSKSGTPIVGTVLKTGNYNYVWAKYAYGDIYEETITDLGTTEPDDARSFSYGTKTITSDGYYKLSGTGLYTEYSFIKGVDVTKHKRVYKEVKPFLSGSTKYYECTLADEPSGKGKLERLGYVTSNTSTTYPDDGEKDGYWYTKVGTDDLKLQSKTIRPGASDYTVTADSGYNGLSSVVVEGDEDLNSNNIMYGVKIFDYSGIATSDATANESDIVRGKTAYVYGRKITGTYEPPTFTSQTKTVTPSAIEQTVTPDDGYDGLSSITVSGDSNLIAENIKAGVSIFGVNGTLAAAASTNNAEAYVVSATDPTVSFKSTSGTIKVYGYAYASSSSGWGGTSTTMYAFDGDGYYRSSMYGSPSKTNCTFGVSNGKLTGLPTLNGGHLLVIRGV